MYCPCRSFNRQVFWESVIVGLVQNSLESFSSMRGLLSHLSVLGKFVAIAVRLLS